MSGILQLSSSVPTQDWDHVCEDSWTLKLDGGGGRAWVAQWFKPLPSAQVMMSGSWDRAPHRALCSAGSLLPPLALCLPLCLHVISVCQINFKKKLKSYHFCSL